MGDITQNVQQLAEEQYRVVTYGDQNFQNDKYSLAKSGFFYTQRGSLIQCFKCNLEIDLEKISLANINQYHKEHCPSCNVAGVTDGPQLRSKKFVSYDSLRFEKERLETFIAWPVVWLNPKELAHDGFYYLRTADHCACVFCRGIVGAWEKGDTPRGEHQRHFPQCPFVKGQPVGNIPLEHSQIISRLSPRSDTSRTPSFPHVDVCGTPRHMPGSYPEKSGPPNKNCMNLESMGLPQHSGPKRRDYLTCESRLASYQRWPELVKQKPTELAEAGFFYCGLSDHVRCFHCGNGLRNWENDDEPWREHARWYPDCNFVLLKQGQEFIDQVRRERPPYLRSQPSAKSSSDSGSTTASASVRPVVSENELDPLMELDIIQAVLVMGFPREKVRATLRHKLEQTGMPFFSLEPCIEAILQYMEEETRQTLHERSSQEIEDEATGQQAAKMEVLQPGSHNATGTMEVSTQRPASPQASTSTAASTDPSPVDIHPESTPAISPSHSISVTSSIRTNLTRSGSSGSVTSSSATTLPSRPLSQHVTAMPVIVSIPSGLPHTSGRNQQEIMEVDEPIETGTVTESIDVINRANEVITQANQVIGMAERALKPPTSGPPSLEHMEEKIERPAISENIQASPSTSGIKRAPSTVSSQTSKELADELERMRESRMCKVCMDAEMDVVFLPCSHMVTCASCALALAQCPICRDDIKYTIKPILS